MNGNSSSLPGGWGAASEEVALCASGTDVRAKTEGPGPRSQGWVTQAIRGRRRVWVRLLHGVVCREHCRTGNKILSLLPSVHLWESVFFFSFD